MTPKLCKKHFREVANHFDKETALLYTLDEKECLICKHVIFVESARRFVLGGTPSNNTPKVSDETATIRLPDAFAQMGA